jgi:hypothetical protein
VYLGQWVGRTDCWNCDEGRLDPCCQNHEELLLHSGGAVR